MGFYGRAVGRHSRPIALQDLVNRDAALEDEWRVEVFIQFDANEHRYDLRRTAVRKPHVATPTRPEDFTQSVFLSRDGTPMTGDQVEPEIDQFAPEQISRFFLFDGELLQEYETLLIEGSEQGRQIKEAIEQVLGVPALINARNELGAIIKAARKRQSSDLAHTQGLERQAQRQQELTAKQEAHERDLEALQGKIATARGERIKLDDELEAAASALAAKGKLDGFVSQRDSLDELQKRKHAERQALLSQAWLDLIDLRLAVRREQLLQRQSVLTKSLKIQGKLQSRIEDLEKLLSTKECPTCHQELGIDRRAEIGTTLGELQAELNRAGDNSSQLQLVAAEIAALNKIRGVNARDRLAQIDRDTKKAAVDLQRVENDIERLKDEIAGHDTAELAKKRVLQREALREETRLQDAINKARADMEKIKEELAVAQKAIEGLASARSQRSTLKVRIATDLEKTFTTSIEQLRDRLRGRVETFASSAFMEMTTQKAYRALQINSNYGLSIMDRDGTKVPLRSAVNRTGRTIGPVVMDTPFGRLDLLHRDNILKYLPTVTSQFVLLVHNGEIRPETDLAAVKPRIGAVYRINEVTPRQSTIERIAL